MSDARSARRDPQYRMVERSAILERLDASPEATLITVEASAGYGKSILLQQWAKRVGPSAYLRLTESHRDPTVLVLDLARALRAITPIDAEVVKDFSSRTLEPGLRAASRLAAAISAFTGSALLVLDDVHVLQERRAADALTVFIEHLPPGIQTAAAGHDVSILHPARMRAAGHLAEVTEWDLSFSEVEARHAAELFGLRLTDRDITSIVAESGGWPVAVTLALHSLASNEAPRQPLPVKVVTRSVADYIRSELVEPLEPEARSWLLRSSVLDVMSGPLCDESLQVTRSLARLRSFERSSLLVQPVDDEATRYRYHPLLRDLLLDELEVASPGEAQAIAARAARWYDERGQSLEALEYGRRAGDRELVANLMARHIWPLHWSGQIATLEHWVDWFDQDGIRERFTAVAVMAGFIFAIDGRRHAAELWLAAAENSTDRRLMPDGSSREAWVAMLRGMLVANGVEGSALDARVAEDGMRGDSPFLPGVRVLSTVASMLAGRVDEAYERAREAMDLADSRGAMPGLAMAAGLAGALALRAGQPRAARRLIEDTLIKLRNGGLEDYVLASLVHAVAARCGVTSGATSQARDHLARVHRLRPLMTASVPWLSVAVRLESIEALVTLRDIASARTLLREVDDILRIRPSLGLLAEDAEAMRVRLAGIDEPGQGQWTLTAAELRVLQYLPTHLTFGEIAERLRVSPHTVKSQAVAIYSKLGVSSRRTAIEAAVRYGLLDGSALRFPLGPGVDAGVG